MFRNCFAQHKLNMQFKFDKQTIMWVVVAIIIIGLVIVYVKSRKNAGAGEQDQRKEEQKEDQSAGEQKEEQPAGEQKESFTVVMNGTNQLGTIGSITGDLVATTGTTWGDAEKALIRDGRIDYADGDNGNGITLGAQGYRDQEISPLDQQMKNHNEVLKLANPDGRQYCTHEEHSQIAQMVHGAGSNDVNLFKRGTTKSLKMQIDPLGTQMVIDEKYLPEKDRHGSMRVVKNVIAGKGYDVNIERMGESLKGFSWAKINREQVIDRENGIVQGVGKAGTGMVETDNIGAVMNTENEPVMESYSAGKYGRAVRGQ